MDPCLDKRRRTCELKEIANRLDAGSVTCSIGSTWTVATTLCHLAFWDQRSLFQLKQWQKSRSFEAARLDSQTVDSINEAVNLIALQVPGPAAIAFALNSTAAVDAFTATIGEELADKIRAAGFERYLRRSLHRREHIRKIHRGLEAQACKVGIGYGFRDTSTDRVGISYSDAVMADHLGAIGKTLRVGYRDWREQPLGSEALV